VFKGAFVSKGQGCARRYRRLCLPHWRFGGFSAGFSATSRREMVLILRSQRRAKSPCRLSPPFVTPDKNY
jgi:hypothetical protein